MKEKVHEVVGLQSSEGHVAGARLEGDWVGNDVLEANHGVELTVIDVTIFTEVYVGQAVEGEALEVADEVRRHHGQEALLCHDARLYVIELQLGVVTCHLTFDQQKRGTGDVIKVTQRQREQCNILKSHYTAHLWQFYYRH